MLTSVVACFAFALLATSSSAATYNAWTARTSGASTSTTLYDIAFADASNGWIVGSAGVIRHTTDGGGTWTAQTSGTTQNLRGVAFVGASNGWVVGNGGVILHTTNGGATWTAQTSGTTQTLRDVVFVDANNGWAVGSAGTIRHTTNAGSTWSAQTSGTTQAFYSLTFRDANNGWAVGGGGTIRRTSNGGTTWTAQTSGVTGTLYGVAFADANNGWAVGQTGTIRRTSNGGTAWSSQTSGTTQILYGTTFLDSSYGWTVGGGGVILRTINGGTAWSSQTSGVTSILRTVISANGSLWACGASGRLLTYLVDVTAPVTTATGLQADNHSGWRTTSQTVSLTATDAQSGVSATYYTVDGGARQTYGAPFNVAGESSHTITYWSVDTGGNTEATHTGYVNIDATAPATTATGLQADDHSGWRTTGQSVSLSAGDGGGSSVSTTTYAIDGGAIQVYAGAPFLVAGNGSHTVTYHSTDVAGNAEVARTGYVNIDTVAPLTVATGLQSDGLSGWRNSSQAVTLTAGDGAGSGVAFTRYTVDGGSAQTYAGAFTVSTPGSHVVTYFSQDAVGNVESTHTGYVNIDTTLPTVAADADSAWHRSPVTVHLTPGDNGGSGVAGTQYRGQGGAWLDAAGNAFVVPAPADGSGDGARVYQFRALDGAGNVSVTHSCTVWIDTQAPSTTASGLASDDLSGWTTSSRTVELTPDDGVGSGVAVTTYSVDGDPSQTYTGAFVVSGAGQHPVTYSSTDAAGNLEAPKTGWVNISNPYAQADGLAADDHSLWSNGDRGVTIAAAGDHQPIGIFYRVGAGTWQTAGNPATFSVSGEGTHRVDFYARNGVGVESAHETGYVNIDLTAPVTTASGLQPGGTSGWTASSQSVSFAAADGLSGLAATYYRLDGGPWLLSTGAPVIVAGDGSHRVAYYSTDAAGNAETARTGFVNIDATAPATTATGLQADDHSGWRTGAQTVTMSAGDAGLSGVAATSYTVDGGGAQTYSAPFAVSGEGSHVVTFWSVDAVGNIEKSHTGFVNIDATAPVSTPGGLQADAHSGWRQTAQDVSLAATDALSGVDGTHYTVDGEAQQTYSGPFTIADDGSHAVAYWSIDVAGNIESHRTGYVNIDATAPTTTATGLQADDHSGWRTADQTVTLSGDDAGLSGAAGTYYTLDGGPQQTYTGAFVVSGDGRHAVTYWSVDVAGNTEAAKTGYVNIDAGAPTTTAAGLQPDAASGWRNSALTVTLSADDAGLSGVAATYYRIDGGARQTYAAPFGVTSPGSHAIVYWSVDGVGNTETAQVGYVNIDLAAPTVTSDADAAWHNSAVTVHLSPADSGGSGLAAVQYRPQGGAGWLTAAGDAFTVAAPADGSGDGAHAYEFRALDGAGNASATGACTVRIDTQGPVVTPTGLQSDEHSGWRQTAQTVSLAADDAGGTGVTAIYYTVDGGATQTYAGDFSVSGIGEHPVVYWATDPLGNESPHLTGWVNISNPYAQASGLANDNHSGWRNTAQTVTITADGDHQPLTVHYRVDGGTWQTAANPASFTVSTQGTHAVDYYASNTVAVESPHQTGYVNIDTVMPTTTAAGLQANNHTGWTTTAPTIALSASDALSGVSATRYTIDGGAAQTYAGPFTVGAPGSHAVAYWSVDAAGNVEATHTGYANIDATAPITSATGLQADSESGWITTTQSVTLTPADAESGVAATYYTVDGGDQQAYAGAFTVTDDGRHEVTYWSVDALGNAEAAKTGYVNIDATAATTTAAGLQANGTSGWRTSAQTVTLSGDDHGGSGISALRYTVDGGATQTYAGDFTVSGQGSHPVVYWSVDAAGNVEATHTGYVNIDLAAPTVTSDADAAWHNSAVTVQLSPADSGGSGLAAVQYRPQGGAGWLTAAGDAFTVAAPADGSGDGAHAYEFRALDGAGNASATGACTVRIDTRKPATTASGLQSTNHTGWRSTAQTVSLAPDDGDGSGIAATRYTVDGGATQTYAGAFTVSGQGSHPVVYWSVDVAGNVEATHTGYVNIDLAAPTVTSDADAAWHNSDVTVHLLPADVGGSGTAGTQYRLQGASDWSDAAGDAFTVAAPADGSGDGAHAYEFRALDGAGNASATGACTVRIDTSAPLTAAVGLQPDNHSGWQTTSQVVSLSADDRGGSGVANITYALDGGARHAYGAPFTVSGSGKHRVTYWAVDALGNLESPHTGYVNIDAVAPVTSAVGLSADDHSGWNTSAQTVSLSATDGLSGVAATYYAIDGGGPQLYSGAFTVSSDGRHPVTYWSVDGVGNVETAGSGYVNIDTAAPQTTAVGLQADAHSGWRTTDGAVILGAGDGSGSGVAATTYAVDGGPAQPYTAPFTVSGIGQHQITYSSTDAAGNSETTHTGWVNISNPYAQASGLANDAHSAWHIGAAGATVAANGDQAPFTIRYSLDGGGTWQTTSSPWTFTATTDGSHRVDYYAVNAVGVESVHQTGYVNVDATAPGTTPTGLQGDGVSGWRTSAQTVTLSGDDHGISGVAHTFYAVDGGVPQEYAGAFTVSGQGSHPVVYWSVDVAGNVEATHTGYVNIDLAAPTVTSDADAAWHNSDVTVHLLPADVGGSGTAGTQYRLQGASDWSDAAGDAFTVAAPADGSGDGAHAYEFRALDGAGNASATGACTVRIDTQGPVAGDDGDAYWHNSAVTVHLTATDAGSGVHQLFYRLQGAPQWTSAPAGGASVTVAAPTDGLPHSYVYEYTSTDNLGTAGSVRTFTVNMDTRMPNTILSGLPAQPWTNKPVSLTYSATPGDGAPIVRTECLRDGGSTWAPWAAGTTLTIGDPGETTILYRSVNAAGRVEDPPRTATVRIDVGRPRCLALKNVSAKAKKKAKLRFKITDAAPTCGTAKVLITIKQGRKIRKKITIAAAPVNIARSYSFKVKLKKGAYKWTVSAVDAAGNTAIKTSTKKLVVN